MRTDVITVASVLPPHAGYAVLVRELAVYGIQTTQQTADGDALTAALEAARARSEMIILLDDGAQTGKAALCAWLGLADDPCADIPEGLPENDGGQPADSAPASADAPAALSPERAVFPNDNGAAPGFAVVQDDRVFMVLPGAATELLPMLRRYVGAYMSGRTGGTVQSVTVGVFGLPESTVEERLADLMVTGDQMVTSYARDGEVALRVTAKGDTQKQAREMCAPVVEEIRNRLGAFVYGVDCGSLQKAVVALLLDKGMKIATAESCTAGMLSSRLTEVPGASAVFEYGVCAYSRQIKQEVLGVGQELLERQGAVSADAACAMARGARAVGGATLGVAISGVAGPEPSEGKPVGTVYIALADEKRVWVKALAAGHTSSSREAIRYLATSHALDLIRRYLEALPAVMAGGQPFDAPPPAAPAVIPKAAPVRGRRRAAALIPWRGDTPGEALRKLLLLLAVAAIIAIGWKIYYTYVLDPSLNRDHYQGIEEIYVHAPTAGAAQSGRYPYGMLPRFYALYDRNPDIKGWVKAEGTSISYPVVQSGNYDYSVINYDRNPSVYGVPYFDDNVRLSSPQSANRSMVIHGVSRDDQMFSQLSRYTGIDFVAEHSIIEMNTIYKTGRWQVFGVFYADYIRRDFDYTVSAFENEDVFMDFIGQIERRSLFTSAVEVLPTDNILMLSTASQGIPDGVRLVVAARWLGDQELPVTDLGLKANRNSIMPDSMRSSPQVSSRTVRTSSTTSAAATSTAGTTTKAGTSGNTESSTTDPASDTTTNSVTTASGSVATHTTVVPVVTSTTAPTTTEHTELVDPTTLETQQTPAETTEADDAGGP